MQQHSNPCVTTSVVCGALNFLLLLLFVGTAHGQLAIGQDLPKADQLAAVYNAEVGVREATGQNDGLRIEEYLAATGLPAGYSWCASFVSWCFIQAGLPALRSAWAPAWFPARKTIYTRTSTRELPVVQRGDVFGIYYPRQNRIAHVGFIDGQQEGFFITVEGNTNANGSRNGDGVYRKRRSVRTIYKISRWL